MFDKLIFSEFMLQVLIFCFISVIALNIVGRVASLLLDAYVGVIKRRKT